MPSSGVAGTTDWLRWHAGYDDPSSELSRRLQVVRERIRAWADERRTGPLRLLSICAGQGRDVVGALTDHPRRADVSGLLVELDPDNTAAAQRALLEAGLTRVRACVGDAGRAGSYWSAVPADLVLVCGVFGNIAADDVHRTISGLRGLCAPDATVVWTRHRRDPDLTPQVRGWFADHGFDELDFHSPGPGRFAVGTHRLAGAPTPYDEQLRLFTFGA